MKTVAKEMPVSQLQITTTDLARLVLFSAAAAGRTRLSSGVVKEMMPPIAQETGIGGFYFTSCERVAMANVNAIWAEICEQAGEPFNRFGIEFTPEEIIEKDWPNVAGPTNRHALCFSLMVVFFRPR